MDNYTTEATQITITATSGYTVVQDYDYIHKEPMLCF
jgi:hypothetical protein